MKKYLILVILLSSCSAMSSATQQCKQWRSEGEFMGTLRSCSQCSENMGNENKEAIRGCALAMDANSMLGAGQ
jgi:hypothetical protein